MGRDYTATGAERSAFGRANWSRYKLLEKFPGVQFRDTLLTLSLALSLFSSEHSKVVVMMKSSLLMVCDDKNVLNTHSSHVKRV